MPSPLRFPGLITLTLGLFLSLDATAAEVVVPFPQSEDYMEGRDLYGSRSGSHRSAFSTRYHGDPAIALRPLSVDPTTSLNGVFADVPAFRKGPGAMPPVYGGYHAAIYRMPEPGMFTSRAQFQDSRNNRGDFVNLNVYLESPSPMGPGIEYRLVATVLVGAGPNGEIRKVPLQSLGRVTYVASGGRVGFHETRVIVRDADSGAFYVSERSALQRDASIDIQDSRWAVVSPVDVARRGEFLPAPFTQIDHIGLYADSNRTEIASSLPGYGVIDNFALHALQYTLHSR